MNKLQLKSAHNEVILYRYQLPLIWRIDARKGWTVCCLLVLELTLFWVGVVPARESNAPNPLGESLYHSHCHRCHGDDGDATDYYNIVPLAGIGRRPPVGLVGRFREAAFSARGIEFSGKRAEALGRYLFKLCGRKGFRDPGWLWSPFLLNRKSALVNECRILDVRAAEEYSSQHIPNAVSVPLDSSHLGLRLPQRRVEYLLQETGIHEDTQVVVYDWKGGPDAAWLWWNLLEAGHTYVAVLDGGWENWVRSGFSISDGRPNIKRSSYHPQRFRYDAEIRLLDTSAREIDWVWKESADSTGFRTAKFVAQLIEKCGLQNPGRYCVSGTAKEAAYLSFLLKLMGRSAQIESAENNQFILLIGHDEVDMVDSD